MAPHSSVKVLAWIRVGEFSSSPTIGQDTNLHRALGYVCQAFYRVIAHTYVGLAVLCSTRIYFLYQINRVLSIFFSTQLYCWYIPMCWRAFHIIPCLQGILSSKLGEGSPLLLPYMGGYLKQEIRQGLWLSPSLYSTCPHLDP